MTAYYVTYLVLFIAEAIFGKSAKGKRKVRLSVSLIAFIAVFLLLAFRHQSMGVDLGYTGHKMGYLPSFDYLNTFSWKRILTMESFLNYEKGYIILNKLVGSICNNRQFFLGVCAFITVAPIMWMIKKKSTMPLLSVVVLMGLPVFLMFFSGLRQSIAIGITVFSVTFIQKKKVVPFILTVLFATLFHKTAIVFLAAYPLYYIRLTDVWKVIFVILIPTVYIFRNPMFMVLSKIFKDNAQIGETGAVTLFIVFCVIYLYLIVLNVEYDEQQNGMINLFYLACLCQVFGGIFQLAMRVGYYFMIYLVIALPNTVTRNKNQQEYDANYLIILFAFLVYGIYSIKNSTWAMAYPYYFFWEW